MRGSGAPRGGLWRERIQTYVNSAEFESTLELLRSEEEERFRVGASRVGAMEARGGAPAELRQLATLRRLERSHCGDSDSDRLELSMALVRFVNEFTDALRDPNEKSSVRTRASEAGLPLVAVALRHRATHAELPQADTLRLGLRACLDWLLKSPVLSRDAYADAQTALRRHVAETLLKAREALLQLSSHANQLPLVHQAMSSALDSSPGQSVALLSGALLIPPAEDVESLYGVTGAVRECAVLELYAAKLRRGAARGENARALRVRLDKLLRRLSVCALQYVQAVSAVWKPALMALPGEILLYVLEQGLQLIHCSFAPRFRTSLKDAPLLPLGDLLRWRMLVAWIETLTADPDYVSVLRRVPLEKPLTIRLLEHPVFRCLDAWDARRLRLCLFRLTAPVAVALKLAKACSLSSRLEDYLTVEDHVAAAAETPEKDSAAVVAEVDEVEDLDDGEVGWDGDFLALDEASSKRKKRWQEVPDVRQEVAALLDVEETRKKAEAQVSGHPLESADELESWICALESRLGSGQQGADLEEDAPGHSDEACSFWPVVENWTPCPLGLVSPNHLLRPEDLDLQLGSNVLSVPYPWVDWTLPSYLNLSPLEDSKDSDSADRALRHLAELETRLFDSLQSFS